MEEQQNGEASLVVLLGDLNGQPNETSYQTLTGARYGAKFIPAPDSFIDTRNGLTLRQQAGEFLMGSTFGSTNTFTAFTPEGQSADRIIDYILVADNGAVAAANALATNEDTSWRITRFGVLPNIFEDGVSRFRMSDHNMVLATFSSFR